MAVVAAAVLGLLAGALLMGSLSGSGSPTGSPDPTSLSPSPTARSSQPEATPAPSFPPLTQRYLFTDLGVLEGLDSVAFGAARMGAGDMGATFVVGHADSAPNSKWNGFTAFMWVDSAGRMFGLGALPGDANSTANDVNAMAMIVGESLSAEGPTHAFLYDGSLHELGGLGGDHAGANAINALGEVAGYASTADGMDHAVLWVPNTAKPGSWTLRDLGMLPGDIGSVAQGVNDQGQVVGYRNDADDLGRAFLWTPSSPGSSTGTMIALGALPGETYASAYAINAGGAVVGEAKVGENAHAFLWQPAVPNGTSGTMTDLGTLGGDWSRATDINAAGDVVGVAEAPAPDRFDYAFLYRNGQMYDLNSALPSDVTGVQLTCAYAITDSGAIIGGATIGNHSHAFLLTPVAGD
jgi:probable HAF family extracellular repeat protein